MQIVVISIATATINIEMQHSKIHLRTAEGHKGGSVPVDKYELIKDFIIDYLTVKIECSLSDLLEEGKSRLSESIHESEFSFLLVKVKGDLEARGIIRRQWQLGRIQMLKLKKINKYKRTGS